MLKLSSIHRYPLKSGRGLSPSSWELGPRGLVGDRRFMVVEADGRFVTQRADPVLATVALDEVPLAEGTRERGAPGQDGQLHRSVEVWGDVVQARSCGADADRWMSARVGREVFVVFMADDAFRQADLRFAQPGDEVSFADGFPVLIANEGSLAALNQALEAGGSESVAMQRFRPNLVIGGAESWAEDGWRRVRIGEVELEIVKPCARCTMVTVDPQTGVKQGKEPLRTLTRLHPSADGQPIFGQNAVARGMGVVRVGDGVTVLA